LATQAVRESAAMITAGPLPTASRLPSE